MYKNELEFPSWTKYYIKGAAVFSTGGEERIRTNRKD